MIETGTLIIGGGLAGLAAGYTLEGKQPYIIAERELRPGGLSATIKTKGYFFDYSGHLLHLRWPETTELILSLLGNNCMLLERNAKVRIFGKNIPFPFQANLKKLPEKVRSECVREFLKAADLGMPPQEHENYKCWAERVFGKGISRHFMLPYNFKLLQHPLDKVTTEWCAPFVPMPDRNDILKGAYGSSQKKFGYNTVFRYPKKGGIGFLAEKLAETLSGLRLGCEVISINMETKTAEIKNLGKIKFRHLINTAPLPFFIKMQENAPKHILSHASRLKSNTVYVLNLGIKKPAPKTHWAYFPEKKYPFYRAGAASNFSHETAPKGKASLYLEFAFPPDSDNGNGKIDFNKLEKTSFQALKECGFIKSLNQIEEKLWLKMNPAYVIYDRERAEALPEIFSWLKDMGIFSIGRYGAWKYSFMEEAIKEGIEAARSILKE